MKKKIIYTLCSLLVCTIIHAQTLVWNQNYSISGSSLFNTGQVTSANGIYTVADEDILSGTGAGTTKIRITRHNYSGAFVNTNAFQFGSTVASARVKKMICDASGNVYFLIKISKFNVPEQDCYLFSYSPTLSLRWVRLINLGDDNIDGDFTITSSGFIYSAIGFRTTGTNTYNIGIRKINMSTGNTIYSGSFVTGNKATPSRIVTDANGNCYVSANRFYSINDGILCRFNNTGALSWSQIQTNTYLSDITLDNFGSTIYACGFNTTAAIVERFNTSGAITGTYTTSAGTKPIFDRIVYNVNGNISVYGTDVIPASTSQKTLNILSTQLNSTLSNVLSSRVYPTGVVANLGITISNVNIHKLPNNSQLISVNMWLVMASNGTKANHLLKINSSGNTVYSENVNEFRNINPVITTSISNTDYISSLESFNIRRYTGPAARMGEPENGLTVTLYPNPVTDNLHINGLEESAQLQLVDLNGRVVMDRQWTPGEVIDVNSLARGLYVLRMQTENGWVSEKVMVE